MDNKKYWEEFYAKQLAPSTESNFANFVLEYLQKNNLTNTKIVDVACGNGRDTEFFLRYNFDVIGIDLAHAPKMKPNYIKTDILTFDYSGFDVIYLRFIVHALKEDELNQLISRIYKTNLSSKIFIETRSSKGITNEDRSETFFKSSIGDEHFRMLYSESYLSKILKKYFEIEYTNENDGVAQFKEDNPICLRYILSHKK